MKLTVRDILKEIRDSNTYASGIAKKYGISRQAVSKRLKRLIKHGLVKEDIKEGKGKIAVFYKLTPKGLRESRRRKEKISKRRIRKQRSITTPEESTEVYIHSFRIKLPLISDQSKDFWETESDLAYGKKYYKRLDGVTLEKVFSNIILHFRFPVNAITSKEFDEEFEKELRVKTQAVIRFCSDNKVIIDSEIKKDTMIEFAIDDPLTRTLRKIGTRIGEFIDLKRLREKIFVEGLDQPAWAKYDSTPQKFTRETNDRRYVRKVLDMPETLDKLGKEFTPAIKKLTEEIGLHLEVQRETQLTLKSIRDEIKKPRIEIKEKPAKEKLIFKTVNGEEIVERK